MDPLHGECVYGRGKWKDAGKGKKGKKEKVGGEGGKSDDCRVLTERKEAGGKLTGGLVRRVPGGAGALLGRHGAPSYLDQFVYTCVVDAGRWSGERVGATDATLCGCRR